MSTPPPTELSAATTEVIEEIRGRIHRGELGPGDRLPAERELASRMHVSRDRVREALLSLETEGYLVSRRGATGGRFVTELADAVRGVGGAHRRRSRRHRRLPARGRVRGVPVRGATPDAQRSARDAPGRRAARRRATTPRDYRLADVAFHASIAIASQNERLAVAVERARGELFEPADELWKDGRIESLADHRHILAAIQGEAARGRGRRRWPSTSSAPASSSGSWPAGSPAPEPGATREILVENPTNGG